VVSNVADVGNMLHASDVPLDITQNVVLILKLKKTNKINK
jgi:hypothetical protein